MKPPVPGLRRFVNDSTEITRLELRVPAGAEIAVDDTVAAQLPPRFKDPDVVAERDTARKALAPDAAPVEVEADEPEPKKKAKKDA